MKVIAIKSFKNCSRFLLNFEVKKQILLFLAFLFIGVYSINAQCPINYQCTNHTDGNLAFTFEFEAGNSAADQNIACDFVVKQGGALIGGDEEDCSGGFIVIDGVVYNFVGDDGGSSQTNIVLTYSSGIPHDPSNCPTDYEIAEAIGCGQTSDNNCLTIIFQDDETGQNCTSSNSYFSMTLNDIGGCGPYTLQQSGNSNLVFNTNNYTTGEYSTQTIKAGIYILIFTDLNGNDSTFIYNHVTENGTCVTPSNLFIDKTITSGDPYSAVGDMVNYQYAVTSDVSVTNPFVSDDRIGNINAYTGDDGDSVLEVGETWVFTGSYSITQDDINAGSVTNLAFARGEILISGIPSDIFSDVDDATAILSPCDDTTFTAPEDLCLDAGILTNIGGGSPAGGVYSGAGVTDDGNGTTYSFNPVAATAGTHTITYSYVDGSCSDSATEDIIVFALPTALAGADAIIDCNNTSALIGTASLAGFTYAWTPILGLDDPAIAQPTATPAVTTIYSLIITETLTGCSSVADEVTVSVDTDLPTALAGADAIIDCNNTSALIGTASVSGFTYAWTPILGLDDPAIAQPTATPAVTTIYSLIITETLTGCSSVADEVTVDYYSVTPDDTALGEVCVGNTFNYEGVDYPVGTFDIPKTDTNGCPYTTVLTVSGDQPEEPLTKCFEIATFNSETCKWYITGDQPEEPVTECYETTTFNGDTCTWDVTGDKPETPLTKCFEIATFNSETCAWDIIGDKPEAPVTECYETATYSDQTCQWEVTGDKPETPLTECYETATFSGETCTWNIIGDKPLEPEVKCFETATFNNETCAWDITESALLYAGQNSNLTVCEGVTPSEAELFNALGGNPDEGGLWSGPVNGDYTYTVESTNNCPSDSAIVKVYEYEKVDDVNDEVSICKEGSYNWYINSETYTIEDSPVIINLEDENGCSYSATLILYEVDGANAGENGTLTVCQGVEPSEAELFDALGGSPTEGGIWSGPVAGDYAYTITSTESCPGSSAIVKFYEYAGTDDIEEEVAICEGGSYLWPVTGYTYTIEDSPVTMKMADANGCKYSATLVLNVISSSGFDHSSITSCEKDGVIVLSGGTPEGGVYYGDGVINNNDGTYSLDPSLMSIGIHGIFYVYGIGTECELIMKFKVEIYKCNVSNRENSIKSVDFKAYPIPYSKEINIAYEFDFETDVAIQIMDIRGLVLEDITIKDYVKNSEMIIPIDLSDANDQILFIKVSTNRGSVVKKIIPSNKKR
ncbi:MAG: hypothetical protein V7719_07010 [Psychroserpens sp.]|uniref:DUF7507 domain-containing protein n=1 Tax=Psychroserpens sp. TaxID=2020870 RepID=UPI00300244C9